MFAKTLDIQKIFMGTVFYEQGVLNRHSLFMEKVFLQSQSFMEKALYGRRLSSSKKKVDGLFKPYRTRKLHKKAGGEMLVVISIVENDKTFGV